MKRYRFVVFLTLLGYFLLGNMAVCHVSAQGTKASHAESMSKVWNGMNVDNVVGNNEYETNGKIITDTQPS